MEIVNTALMVVEPNQQCVFMYTNKAFETMTQDETRNVLRVMFDILNDLISRRDGYLLESCVEEVGECVPVLKDIISELVEKNIFRRMVYAWGPDEASTKYCYRCFYDAWSFHGNMFIFYICYADMLIAKRRLAKTNQRGIFMYDQISY